MMCPSPVRSAALIGMLLCAFLPPALAQDVEPKAAAVGADAPQTTAVPASAPAKGQQDPLCNPHATVKEFLRAINAAEQAPEHMAAALRCLDLSELQQEDAEKAHVQGALLAEQLEEILDALINIYGASTDAIPEEPGGRSVAFPAEGDVRLELARGGDGLWRFSAATVAAIPDTLKTVKEKEKQEQVAAAEDARDVPPGFRSARTTMRTYLEAMHAGDTATAIRCFDLSDQPMATRTEIGSVMAQWLLFVMDRIEYVIYTEVPDRTAGEPYVWYLDENGRIELAPAESGPQEGWWLFTKATVNSLESLHKSFAEKPVVAGIEGPSFWDNPRRWLQESVPPSWKADVLTIELWQWAGIGLFLAIGYAVFQVVSLACAALIRPFGRSRHVEFTPDRIASTVRPLGMLAMLVIWWFGLWLLLIPVAVQTYVWPALKFVMTAVGVWAAYRLIDLISDYFGSRARLTVTRLDDVLVPLLRKTGKIVIVALGSIFILKALGVTEQTVGRVFAGLGIGGLAFAFAAQDSIRNFFGSITVVLDRPFQVGDWVKVGNVEGTVESVGLRSSRIRTFYNSEVCIPNSELITATVDNMGRRRYRRIKAKISVLYSTSPEQLEAFCEGIRELIRQHPYTRKDFYMAWVNQFAASSIDILLYCFHETPDWATELRERHRLFLDIIRLAKRLGVEFAFPTQTIHIARDGGEDQPSTAPSMGRPADARTPKKQAAELGRKEAAEVAARTLEEAGGRPPPFKFPRV